MFFSICDGTSKAVATLVCGERSSPRHRYGGGGAACGGGFFFLRGVMLRLSVVTMEFILLFASGVLRDMLLEAR